jgi:Uma2 family endonuclease
MAAPTKKRATYQDVLDAPPHKVAEILNGVLHVSPRPGAPHTSVSSALGGELYNPFQRGRGGPGGWVILDEPELHHDDNIVVPDLAGWRRERLPAIPDAAYFTVAPDWVCETLSPSTERIDRIEKLPFYAGFGVRYVWFVHPSLRSLEVMRLQDGKWLVLAIHHEDDRVHAEPFDAIELDLALLWEGLPPLPTRASEDALAYTY